MYMLLYKEISRHFGVALQFSTLGSKKNGTSIPAPNSAPISAHANTQIPLQTYISTSQHTRILVHISAHANKQGPWHAHVLVADCPAMSSVFVC